MKSKKKRTGIVYSTNPDFNYVYEEENQPETLNPNEQNLKISIDRKHRGGKTVTLIEGFTGIEEDLIKLGKLLKSKCGVGGSVKDKKIIIQGDNISKVADILNNLNYNIKIIK